MIKGIHWWPIPATTIVLTAALSGPALAEAVDPSWPMKPTAATPSRRSRGAW